MSPAPSKRPPLSKGASRPKVVISGYYGFDNLGDELILHVLIEQLKKRNLDIIVLSNNPAKTEQQYRVKAISRTSPIQIIQTMSQSHLFISGGGGLFQDATGPMSTVYYGGLIALARFLELPVCFLGQGLGPLNRSFSKTVTQKALSYCSMITVRDEASANLVEELIGTRPHLVMDPVWLLELPEQKRSFSEDAPWKVGISLRPWEALNEGRIDALAHCLAKLSAKSTRPMQFVLLPFQTEQDKPVLTLFEEKLKALGIENCQMANESQLLEVIPQCHMLFGMRFHSIILAILADVAVYGLIYDPKVEQLLEMLGLQGTQINQLESLDNDGMVENIQAYFNNYPEVPLSQLRQGAYRNFEVLDALLLQQNFSEFILDSNEGQPEHLKILTVRQSGEITSYPDTPDTMPAQDE